MEFHLKFENWEFDGTHSTCVWLLTDDFWQACDGCLEVIRHLNSLLKVSLDFTLLEFSTHLNHTVGNLKRVWVGRIRPTQVSLMRFRINTLWVTILFELSAPGFTDPSHLRVWVQGCPKQPVQLRADVGHCFGTYLSLCTESSCKP